MDFITKLAFVAVSSKSSAVCDTNLLPVSTALIAALIKFCVVFDASADFPARLRTSSATTAKPFPDVPARAASTDAFNARILVWNAISSIVLIIPCICPEVFLICSIALTSSCIFHYFYLSCFLQQ